MKKCALASAVSIACIATSQPVLAASMTCSVGGGTNNGLVYTTTNTSNGIAVAAPSPVSVFYVSNTLPSASNTASPAVTLIVNGDWCIDTTSGAFSGNIAYGDYKTQVNAIAIGSPNGRQSFTGVNQFFSGTAIWSGSSLTYSYLNTTVNGGGASVQTQTSATCADGATGFPKICTAFAAASKDWEGLSFVFNFDPTKYSFTGQLTATDTSGAGALRNTVTINWNTAGVDPPAVSIPAAGWLFGSALLGLAAGRRRMTTR